MIAENIADYIAFNAIRRGDHIALIDATRKLTYAELNPEMMRYASFLRRNGVARGEIVGLTMRDGVDHVVAMLAIIRLGAVLLPMDARCTSVEKNNIACAFGASHVLTDVPEDCVLSGASVITHDPHVIGTELPVSLPEDFSADDPLLLSLSSGTTGTPKGPQLTHRQMILRHYSEWLSLGFHPDDVNLCATPLYFGGGRGFTLSYLMGGATVVFCPPPYRSDDIASLIRRHGVTTTFLVPTLLRRTVQSPPDVRSALQSLRLIISSGSALHPSERDEMLTSINPNIVNFYASTEGGGISILNPHERGDVARSVGRPVLGSRLQITDNDGHLLATGEIGHIRQSAPWHPDGFYRNPEETARFFQDGWYLPGDLGYLDEGGYLFITGRSKDVIIRGGVNVYPDEIEAVLLTHPAVKDAAVIGRPSPLLGETIVAFVAADEQLAQAATLAQHCNTSLASYKIPAEFHFLGELPRNSSGKIIKSTLAERLNNATNSSAMTD